MGLTQRIDRDRGTPYGVTPPTPPGIRVAYRGGSTRLSGDGDQEPRKTERVEDVVAQSVLYRRVSGHVYQPGFDLTDGVGCLSRCVCRPSSSGHDFLLR